MVFNMYRCFQMLIHFILQYALVKVDITVHLYFTDEKLRHGQLNAMDQYFRELKFLLCSLDQDLLCVFTHPSTSPPLSCLPLAYPSLLTDHPESLLNI